MNCLWRVFELRAERGSLTRSSSASQDAFEIPRKRIEFMAWLRLTEPRSGNENGL